MSKFYIIKLFLLSSTLHSSNWTIDKASRYLETRLESETGKYIPFAYTTKNSSNLYNRSIKENRNRGICKRR